jgi:hypothetical protein
MQLLLRVLTVLFIFSVGGCSNERTYVYPSEQQLELKRICRFVSAENTNRFMVLLGKIYPLNNDGHTAALEEISTNLEDAGYFCGNFRMRNAPCSIGKNKRIDQTTCAFSR